MSNAVLASPATVDILQTLIRLDTSTSAANVASCMQYIGGLLEQRGIPVQFITAPGADHPNLVARIIGDGTAAPLLLYGHVDVVTAEGQSWTRLPFSGDVADGYIWGRGALDMKGGLAMMLSALLRLTDEHIRPACDIVFVVVGDEETGGNVGAKYLAEQRAELFKDIHCAIGEFGGFTQYVSGKRFYPVQVAEKMPCKLQATIRGKGGHSASYIPDNTMTLLGRFLTRLNERLLPVHVTPVARQFIGGIAAHQRPALRTVLQALLVPALTDRVVSVVSRFRPDILALVPMLRNTVNATIVQSGNARNVIPETATVDLDARLLPGFTADEVIAELKSTLGMAESVSYHVTAWEPVPTPPVNESFFALLRRILNQADPDGVPVPLLLSASTDGRHFAKLGIQTFGFLPMRLPPDFNFLQTIHAANERIPLEALGFGADCIFEILRQCGR